VKRYFKGLENNGPLFASDTSRQKDIYLHDETVTDVVRCLLGLPLSPVHDIVGALQNIPTDHTAVIFSNHVSYVKRQWQLDQRSVGPNRLCVRG